MTRRSKWTWVWLVLCACPSGQKGGEPGAIRAPTAGGGPPADGGDLVDGGDLLDGGALPTRAQVKISGSLDWTSVKAAKVRAYVAAAPCEPLGTKVDALGGVVAFPSALHFEIVMFVPQGTRGYVCGVAYDNQGRVVGTAASAKSPFAFQGQGEVPVTEADLLFRPLPAPRPAPVGLEP